MSSPSLSDPRRGVDRDASIPGTWGLVAVLVLVHAVTGCVLLTDNRLDPFEAWLGSRSVVDRVELGGRYAILVSGGQWWRLSTCILLHTDILHLFVNCIGLLSLGRMLEPWLGGARVLGLFVVSGIFGAALAQGVGVVASDGASGGAFGWLGAAIVWGIRARRDPGCEDRALLGPGLWAILGINLILSVALPFVDVASHVGGLVGGVAVAAVDLRRSPRWVWVGLALGFLAVCGGGWLGLLG